jgi:hypothetical protein
MSFRILHIDENKVVVKNCIDCPLCKDYPVMSEYDEDGEAHIIHNYMCEHPQGPSHIIDVPDPDLDDIDFDEVYKRQQEYLSPDCPCTVGDLELSQ